VTLTQIIQHHPYQSTPRTGFSTCRSTVKKKQFPNHTSFFNEDKAFVETGKKN
jgi:hypothetical protein